MGEISGRNTRRQRSRGPWEYRGHCRSTDRSKNRSRMVELNIISMGVCSTTHSNADVAARESRGEWKKREK